MPALTECRSSKYFVMLENALLNWYQHYQITNLEVKVKLLFETSKSHISTFTGYTSLKIFTKKAQRAENNWASKFELFLIDFTTCDCEKTLLYWYSFSQYYRSDSHHEQKISWLLLIKCLFYCHKYETVNQEVVI